MKVIYPILLVVGVILLLTSLFLFKDSLDSIKNGIRATATVIEHEKVYDTGGRSYTYKPIFLFKTTWNEEVVFAYHSSSRPAAFDIGEEVPIVYNRNKPTDADVLTYFGAFEGTIVLMSIALPLIIIGGGYFFTQKYLR
jgi:hypothetical protein